MITLVPIGGLGNRMRAIASGIALSEATQQKLCIVWIKDKGLNCRFDELFYSPKFNDVCIKEHSLWNKFAIDYPEKAISIFLRSSIRYFSMAGSMAKNL